MIRRIKRSRVDICWGRSESSFAVLDGMVTADSASSSLTLAAVDVFSVSVMCSFFLVMVIVVVFVSIFVCYCVI